MGKRSCTSNLIELEYEEGVALRSSKRRARLFASNTDAMSLLALRTKPPTALSEDAFPSNKPLFPLQPQRLVKAVNYSSITDDEDENGKKEVVASKKRPAVFHVGPSLTLLALRKPLLSTAGTRRHEAPNHRKFSFGRPLPPAPLLPSFLMSRRVIPSTNKL
jgi:hypothetical protein